MSMGQTLVSADILAARLTAGDELLVVDCRFDLGDTGRGEREHALGHVPGAVYAHLDRDLSDTGHGLGRHPLPDPADFAATLARLGWRPGLAVVAYDDVGGAIAARLWWLLRLAGHADCAVLDGGWQAWRDNGHPVESMPPAIHAQDIAALRFDQTRFLGHAELEAFLASDKCLLLDVRAAPRYRGENEPIDPVAGHVPGAINRPLGENLIDGRFKDAAILREEYTQLIDARDPSDVVHMCGSGVTACHGALAMEHAGLTGSRIYAPSWSGWISDPARPIHSGPNP